MKPPKDTVDATLKQIEIDSRHPTRKLAARLVAACRERVSQWQSDAEREGLPRVNVIDTGKPLLRADVILAHDHHDRRLGRK